MRPSAALASHRTDVLAAAARHQTANVRLFGSALRGNDIDTSDLDILVDTLPHTTLFDLGGLQVELERMLGVKVDVLTPVRFTHQVSRRCAGAIPIDMSVPRLGEYLDHMLKQ